VRFSDSFLDEIRGRLPVSQVVARKVALKRAGREMKGLSPFKQERTPSFFVNDHKGSWFDFSSGQNGDIFKFVMLTEGLGFLEAVERLAEEAGLPLPNKDPLAEKRFKQHLSLLDAMEAATRFYAQALHREAGAGAREYIERRGLNPETVREFRLGYAQPDRMVLKTELLRNGFTESQLLDCGLLIRPDNGGPTYDRFRGRVMIPIHDQRGRVIAFGGRTIRADVQPKYLNSPETELFHKRAVVFNFHRARQAAFEGDELIVVEGYLDAISVFQAGIKNVVATLGTAFTEDQLQQLWRLASSPTICFDGDRAGEEAAFRAVDRILPGVQIGQSFKFAFLAGAKDPDDLVREHGPAALLATVRSAIPFHEAMWQREVRSANIDTPEGKASLERRLYRLTETIADAAVRRHYMTTIRVRLSQFFWEHGRNSKRAALHSPELGLEFAPEVERIVLGMAVEYPEMFEDHWEAIRDLNMTDAHTAFRNALIEVVLSSEDRLVATIYAKLDKRYYFVLNLVHGDANPDRKLPRGHRLYGRCPVLRLDPDPSFIEDYFVHYICLLEVRAETAELEVRLVQFNSDQTEENERLLLGLKRAIDRRQQEIAAREHDLVERLEEIRSRHQRVETAYKRAEAA